MKSFNLFIFLLLSICLNAQSYKFSYSEVPDSNAMVDRISSFSANESQIEEFKKSTRYIKYSSMYFSENIIKSEFDSLKWLSKGGSHKSINNTMFIDLNTNNLYAYNPKYDTLNLGHKVINIKDYNYVYTKEYKEINNFKCQKVILETPRGTVTFWLTKDLPLPICPGNYTGCGLPGVVVLLEDSIGMYSFHLNKIEKLDYSLNHKAYLSTLLKSKKIIDLDSFNFKMMEILIGVKLKKP